eukprot:CAMPEP_0113470856 /NCGR_PEP_ID=MMETSP0014_2-20120614/16671_1 /TAXON_ID=2857 /ORGANISM="Nitzschia sp." /LENGTH=293 /DNA_ID=CAMNT_0000363459 /DNA_START=293 /DNA_END=1171 /DNA_ORIENTATION=+ /assembly_acc=CAM_ASM_000159
MSLNKPVDLTADDEDDGGGKLPPLDLIRSAPNGTKPPQRKSKHPPPAFPGVGRVLGSVVKVEGSQDQDSDEDDEVVFVKRTPAPKTTTNVVTNGASGRKNVKPAGAATATAAGGGGGGAGGGVGRRGGPSAHPTPTRNLGGAFEHANTFVSTLALASSATGQARTQAQAQARTGSDYLESEILGWIDRIPSDEYLSHIYDRYGEAKLNKTSVRGSTQDEHRYCLCLQRVLNSDFKSKTTDWLQVADTKIYRLAYFFVLSGNLLKEIVTSKNHRVINTIMQHLGIQWDQTSSRW